MLRVSTAPRNSQTRLASTLSADVRTVLADVRRRGVRREIGGTLSGIEAFYLTDEDRRALAAMKPLKRLAHRVWWLLKSLLFRLTPARRVMLAAALVMIISGVNQIQFQQFIIGVRFPWLGTLLLVGVLMLELKDKLVARDELEAGRAVQLAFLPDRTPAVPGWDVWLHTTPANDVGGDVIDYLRIDDRRHAVALGDVAGKALPAALLMVKLQATLRALVPQFDTLSGLGAGVNRILARDGLPSRFASLVYVELSEHSGEVRLLNAGHMPPLVVRGRLVDWMPHGSVVLGILPDAEFPEQRVTLDPGDLLVVYSDGVSEAMNEAGDFFGDERLRSVVSLGAGLPVDELGQRILGAVQAFVGEAPPHDDLSLMVLKRPRADAGRAGSDGTPAASAGAPR